jgi:hypothetical protein
VPIGRSGGAEKGAGFERAIAKLLAKWWTGREGTNTFMRQKGSGGDPGYRGDLKIPEDLFLHIECKTGAGWSLDHFLHRTYETKKSGGITIWGWHLQAMEDVQKRAKEDAEKFRPIWLICSQPRREPLLIYEEHLMGHYFKNTRTIQLNFTGPIVGKEDKLLQHARMVVVPLAACLELWTPNFVKSKCDGWR